MRGGIYINNLYYNINAEDEKIKESILEFIDALEEYNHLQFIEIPYLWKVYAESIGREIYRNYEIVSYVLELKEEIESTSDHLYKNILNDYKRVESSNKSSELKEELKGYEEALDRVISNGNKTLKGFMEENRIREVYKKLIFMYHPIVRKDKIELWAEISKSYKELNLESLEKIYFLGKDFGYENWKIIDIEVYKKKFEKTIRDLKNSFPFVLKDEILDEEWRKEKAYKIYENNMKFESEAILLEEKLESLEKELKEKKGLA